MIRLWKRNSTVFISANGHNLYCIALHSIDFNASILLWRRHSGPFMRHESNWCLTPLQSNENIEPVALPFLDLHVHYKCILHLFFPEAEKHIQLEYPSKIEKSHFNNCHKSAAVENSAHFHCIRTRNHCTTIRVFKFNRPTEEAERKERETQRNDENPKAQNFFCSHKYFFSVFLRLFLTNSQQ